MLSKTCATGITLLAVACGSAAGTVSAATETPEARAATRILLAQASDPFEQAFWDTVKESNNPADYEAYLEAFPDGQFVALARARVITLRGEAAPAGATATQPAESAASAAYEVVRRANLRQSPTGSSARVARLQPGVTVAVTGQVEGGRWLQVTLQDGRNGYVIAEVLRELPGAEVVEPSAPETTTAVTPATTEPSAAATGDGAAVSATVTRNGQLRQAPTATSRRTGRARKGDSVTVTGKDASGEWYYAENEDGKRGYLHRSIVGDKDLQVATLDEQSRVDTIEEPPPPPPAPAPSAQATIPQPIAPPASPPVVETEPEPPLPVEQDVAPVTPPAEPIQVATPPVAPEPPVVEPEPEPAPIVKVDPPPAPASTPSTPQRDDGGFRDCPRCPQMVALRGGRFAMGSNSGDSTERPLHDVSLSANFAMGRYEVSVAEWQTCVEAGGCASVGEAQDSSSASTPIKNVSWRDASDFVRWLAKYTGKPYRLPTEAEWEYAARGGTRSRFWWGNKVGDGNANCRDCGGTWDRRKPAESGSYAANPFGLHDTSGGVWEWVSDCWHDSYTRAPANGSSWEKSDCRVRVLRGGSWRNDSSYLHSSSRFKYDAEVRYKANGFRVAMDLE